MTAVDGWLAESRQEAIELYERWNQSVPDHVRDYWGRTFRGEIGQFFT